MKLKSFTLSIVLLAATSTSAFAHWHHHHYRCSPEMTQNSTSLVQKTLSTAAADQKFASATSFQEFVATTATLQPTAKLHAYLGAVGVDSNDAAAVAEFIGARDHSSYVFAAEKNLGLTQAQADLLVGQITTTLLNLTSGIQK